MRSPSILSLCVLCSSIVLAQAPAGKATDDEAAQAYSQQQWDKSEQLYGALAQSQPDECPLLVSIRGICPCRQALRGGAACLQ